jgi:hypothetical protein
MSRSEWKLRLNEESKSENIQIITPFDFQGQRSKLGYSHGDTSCMIQILSIIFYKQYLYIYIYIYNIVLNASAGTLILRFISNTVTVVICVFAETWRQKGIIMTTFFTKMLFVTGHLQILYVPPFSTLKLSPLLFKVLNDFTHVNDNS